MWETVDFDLRSKSYSVKMSLLFSLAFLCRWTDNTLHGLYINSDCDPLQPSIFLDEICQVDKLRDSYGEMADCCAKADPERNQCFLSFKVHQPDFIAPYQRPAADVICNEYKDHRVQLLGK